MLRVWSVPSFVSELLPGVEVPSVWHIECDGELSGDVIIATIASILEADARAGSDGVRWLLLVFQEEARREK